MDNQQKKHHIYALYLLYMPSTSQDNISVLFLDDLCFLIESIAYQVALQFLNRNINQTNEMREASLTSVVFRTQWLHTCKSLFWKLYFVVQGENVH